MTLNQISPEHPPEDLSIPVGQDLNELYSEFMQSGVTDSFRLPEPSVNIYEEAIVQASKLDGRANDWVRLLLERGNPESAACVALESLDVFGEPQGHPQDAWLPEMMVDEGGLDLSQAGTHPTLNALRRALLVRMTDKQVAPQSRLHCGDLLGSLGGDPRYEICANALILKDEYWQWIGQPEKTFDFLMGDMEIPFAWTKERELLELSLPSFKMAGLFVTNAQYLCFVGSDDFLESNWWPYGWLPKNAREGYSERFSPIPPSLRHNKGMIEPVRCNYLQAYAYVLWERVQRIQNARLLRHSELRMPSEAELEAACRSHPQNSPLASSASEGRWRFPFIAGELNPKTGAYTDLRPWHFNHNEIVGMRATPVGMWPESAVGQLQDLSGNLWSWTISAHADELEKDAVLGIRQPDKEDTFSMVAARGGCYDTSASRCRSGSRGENLVLSWDSDFGFRMVIQEPLTKVFEPVKFLRKDESFEQPIDDSNYMDFFRTIADDWLVAEKKGITQVPHELASVASCENCAQYSSNEYYCSIHQQSVNKDSWTCDQFVRSTYSEEMGGIYDGESWSFRVDVGHYIESAPISVEGALAGDADCCFVVGCLLCDPITRGLLTAMLAPNETVRQDTHVIIGELTGQFDVNTLKENDARKWFHKAAYEFHRLTPGAQLAQGMLNDIGNVKQKVKNIMDCKKYMNSIIEQSDYFKNMSND